MGCQSNEWVSLADLGMMMQQDFICENRVVFDTNSGKIGVDSRCSACISHVIGDFVGNMVDCGRIIKGFVGTRMTGVNMGKLVWRWKDNDGITHRSIIPNSCYVPSCKVRFLSRHHWDKSLQTSKDII
jgi:hypothetical protein